MRFRRRSILLVLAASLLVAVLVLVATVQHRGKQQLAAATERFELAFGALDARAHAPANVPDHENAAVAIQLGTASLALSEADKSALDDFLAADPRSPSPALVDLLSRHAEALNRYRRAGSLRASSFGIDYSAGIQAPLPTLIDVLLGKKLLLADARAGLAAGDMVRVLADSSGLASLHRALENEPMVVFQLFAMSVEIAHHQLIQDVLSSELATITVLETLAGQLENEPSTRANTWALQTTLAVEGSSILAVTDDAAIEPVGWWATLRQVSERLAAPFQKAAVVDVYYHLAKAAELPATQIENYLADHPPSHPVAHILIPNLIDCLAKSRASTASRRGARLALTLQLHALRHGDYPKNLDDFPEAAAPDAYANGTIVFEPQAAGAALLSMPEAAALWRAKNAHAPNHRPHFTWYLPSVHLPNFQPEEGAR